MKKIFKINYFCFGILIHILMKSLLLYSFLIMVFTGTINAQCYPDMAVTDTDNPGEIFPLTITFKQGIGANLTLTIIPPPTAIQGIYTFNLYKIVVRSIGNKPAWLQYEPNAPYVQTGSINPTTGFELVVGQKYCMQVTGVPDGSFIGTDSMSVIVDAYIGNETDQVLLAENQNGGYITFSVCAESDTNCAPTTGVVFPWILTVKENQALNNMQVSHVTSLQYRHQDRNYNIHKMVLRSIENMPSWMTYTCNAPTVTTGSQNPVQGYEFLVGQKNNVFFNGIPDASFIGSDTIDWRFDVYEGTASAPTLLFENVSGYEMPLRICLLSDTSCHTTGVKEINYSGFALSELNPTLFSSFTKVAFTTNTFGIMSLSVYDILGSRIYNEEINAMPGENYFSFNGDKLKDGAYLYSVTDGKRVLTGRFVKTGGDR